jgi:uncharacterized protein YjbI with pentapeptide repeats
MDASELLKRYAVGERDFLRVELSGANLSGDNLSEAKLSRANLYATDLSRANLSGADLIGADLRRAYLYATDLSGAYLISADLISADLCQADLRRANLSGARLIDADLIGADLSQAELIGADLSEAHLIGAKLIGADLRRADLSEANLRGADLIGADLRRADLSRAKLIDADLRRANLSGADLSGADLNNTNLIRAKFNENILTSQKISEELQQENRELRKRIEFFETQIENLIEDQVQKRLITNQGITAKKQTWNRLRFRSNAELEIAKVLDEIGVMYFPNASGRVMSESGMKTREVDFLICSRGKWGILECDGELWHFFKKGELPSAANDHKRDNDFNRHGQWFIKRFTAEECKKAPHQVVRQFLDMLHKFHEDQRYLVTGDFPQTEPSPLQSNLSLAEYDEDEDIVF